MSCTERQAREQVNRLLSSPVFRGGGKYKANPSLSNLLEYIGAHYGKEPVTEIGILVDVLKVSPNSVKEGDARARVYAGRLREKIDLYYIYFGSDDSFRVDVPANAYDLSCEPNRSSSAYKETVLGFYHVDREEPDEIDLAIGHFERAIVADESYAEAYVGLSSALITRTLHTHDRQPGGILAQAEMAAKKAQSLNDRTWRAWINLGVVHYFRHEWEDSDSCMIEAANLEPLALGEAAGYGPYLLSRGRYQEATDLAEQYALDGFVSPIYLVRAALYNYVLRDYQLASKCIDEALALDKKFWRTHLGAAYVCLATSRASEAAFHMDEIAKYTGLKLWPGMRILCLLRSGQEAQGNEEYVDLQRRSQHQYVQPMQLALACIAMGDSVRAVSYLSEACEQFDPVAAWLHLWPVLDPIQDEPAFRSLLTKRGLPSRRR